MHNICYDVTDVKYVYVKVETLLSYGAIFANYYVNRFSYTFLLI